MFEWFRQWVRHKNRRRDGVDRWKQEVLRTLIDSVLPHNEPFYYDTAFSFLQFDRSDLTRPIRVSLFLPNYPLAIDVVGADLRPKYNESSAYISRSEWSRLHGELAEKAERLARHHCPYLLINDYDPVDSGNLRDRIRALTGRS